jgi:hypothetical protein
MHKTCFTRFIASATLLGVGLSPSGPVRAAGVTLADLEGPVIETSDTYDRTGRSGDQVVSGSLQHDRTITIGPGGNLYNTLVHTIGTPRGPVVRQESGSATIGKPKHIQSLGGGDAVWIFENGTLAVLRTYRSGGYKMEIVFTRDTSGISCKVRAPYARENGTGSIEMASAGGAGAGEHCLEKRSTEIGSVWWVEHCGSIMVGPTRGGDSRRSTGADAFTEGSDGHSTSPKLYKRGSGRNPGGDRKRRNGAGSRQVDLPHQIQDQRRRSPTRQHL